MIPKVISIYIIATVILSITSTYLYSNSTHRKEINEWKNPRPIIGILTQPDHTNPRNKHYIAASYVKWLEAAGARSIVIPQNANNDTMDKILSQINGVLLTGGGAVPDLMPDSVRRIWDVAIEKNDQGDIFPIWATCLGFEMMVTLIGVRADRNFHLNQPYDAENLPLPLVFTWKARNSELFSNPTIYNYFKTLNITMNNHKYGIAPHMFHTNKALSNTFHILSTNVDRKHQPFVSTIQAKNYPFWGVQWHPEKNNFEYNTFPNTDIPIENIPHFSEAVQISNEMSRIFVDTARQNSHLSYQPMADFPFLWDYPLIRSHHSFQEKYIINVTKWNYHHHENVGQDIN